MTSNYIDFIGLINSIIERTDNVMALVPEQRMESDKKFKEIKEEFALTKGQVHKLVNTIQELTKDVTDLRKNADKKGKKRLGRVKQSLISTPPPPRPTMQAISLSQSS